MFIYRALTPDLETAIENAYQEMNPEDPVFVIRQKISNRKHHSCQYLLSDYFLENRRPYFNNKLNVTMLGLV